MYSTWQVFGQALLVNSPLLSYIDVRHANFLPPRLTVGEARDLGPRYTCSDELAPIRDESVERVSRRRRELAHQQVEQEAPPQAEPEAPAQAEEAVVELVSSSRTESEMVTRKVMTISRFIPGTQPSEQQQPPPSSSLNSPSSSSKPHSKKATYDKANLTWLRRCADKNSSQSFGGITIWEPTSRAALNVASTSQAAPVWQPSFMLDGKPLPSTASVWVWEKGEGGRVAQSLVHEIGRAHV